MEKTLSLKTRPQGGQGMRGIKMKAYILSVIHGTVQIGDTVFQPCTGGRFKAPRKGLKKQAVYVAEVKNKGMASAIAALHMPLAGRIPTFEDPTARRAGKGEKNDS